MEQLIIILPEASGCYSADYLIINGRDILPELSLEMKAKAFSIIDELLALPGVKRGVYSPVSNRNQALERNIKLTSREAGF